jgi:hypothetical protein
MNADQQAACNADHPSLRSLTLVLPGPPRPPRRR